MSTASPHLPASTSALARLRRWRPEISTEALILLASAFFALVCNGLFWRNAMATNPGSVLFALSLFALLMGVHALLLGLLVWRWNAKVLLTVLFVTTAFATHYMNSFNVYLDADMLRNVLATDHKESSELMTPALLLPLLVYALVPCVLLWRLRLRRRSWGRALLWRLLFLVGVVVVSGAGTLASFQNVSALMRNHREVRYLATPANYLIALKQNLISSNPIKNKPKLPLGTDAKATPRAADSKPRLLVLVVGETVRAQNWGLNGYARQTTPELAKAGVINFPDMHACGTSTEVSLPCMFSPFGRHDYDAKKIRAHQSLLHVLEHAGIPTLWRDNQSGCKGVCEGLEIQRLGDATKPGLCADGRCMDEILLDDLAAQLHEQLGDVDAYRARVEAGSAEARCIGQGLVDVTLRATQLWIEHRTDRAGIDRAVGMSPGALVDRAHVQARRAPDAPKRLSPKSIRQHMTAPVVEQDDVDLLRPVAVVHTGPHRRVGVHPLARAGARQQLQHRAEVLPRGEHLLDPDH